MKKLFKNYIIYPILTFKNLSYIFLYYLPKQFSYKILYAIWEYHKPGHFLTQKGKIAFTLRVIDIKYFWRLQGILMGWTKNKK